MWVGLNRGWGGVVEGKVRVEEGGMVGVDITTQCRPALHFVYVHLLHLALIIPLFSPYVMLGILFSMLCLPPLYLNLSDIPLFQ